MRGFCLLFLHVVHSNPYKLGAVLREKEDAHIAAAVQYAADWLNRQRKYAQVNYHIEYISKGDHHAAINKACTLIEKHGAIAILGTADSSLNDQLNRLTQQLKIPLLTTNDNMRLSREEGRVDFFPRPQLFEALTDLFRHWKWNRITIVYEEDSRMRRIEPLLESEEFSNIRFVVVKIHNKDYMKAAREVKEAEDCRSLNKKDCSEFNRVLLDLSPEETYNFLLAALRMGLIELKHWFLLTSMELASMDMDLFRHNHARFLSPNPVDLSFEKRTNGTFSFDRFQDHVRRSWDMKTSGNINFKMETAGLSGDLRRLNGDPLLSNFSMRIQLLGYSGELGDIGFWEPSTNVHVNMSIDSKAQLQRNVQVSDELKPHFRVTTILERPYIMLKKNHYELEANHKFEGFCIDLLAELSRDLGFTYSIHLVKDGKYGNEHDGTWDGMIGEILRGEAEMAVAPLTVNFKRAEVVDFTKPFLSLGISILYKVPLDQQPDLFSFLNPLSWQIWMAIVTAIGSVTLGMFVVARTTPYEWNLNFSCCTAHQPHPAAALTPAEAPIELSNNYSFFNTLWYVTSTMLKGGCDFGPRAVSTRLLGGTWWVFTLVIISAYTANLAAVLTVSRPYISIKNLDDLANQTIISYGTIRGGSTMQFFQESKIETHLKMWHYMQNREVFVSDNGKGVDRVLTDNYAFLMESTSLEYEVQQNCNLTQIGGVLGSKGYGIAVQRGSEWTDRISHQLLLYAKRGIIEMKKTKWWRSKSVAFSMVVCPRGASCAGAGSAVNEQRLSLNMHNVAGLFIILGVGLFLGVLTVVCELLFRARQISKQSQKPMHTEITEELKYALNMNRIEEHHTRRKSERPTT